MAFIIELTLSQRYHPSLSFPKGSVDDLIRYWGPGPVKLFDRSQIPQTAMLYSGHKLPEFVSINAKLAVCPEAKSVIEELEPGRHQFFAVAITRAKGAVPIQRLDGTLLQTPYYLFNPSVRLDAVYIEKSEVKVFTYKNLPPLVQRVRGREDRIVLRRAIIEGHHVWSGERELGSDTFFSDTLTQAVLDRKWKGLEFTRLREE